MKPQMNADDSLQMHGGMITLSQTGSHALGILHDDTVLHTRVTAAQAVGKILTLFPVWSHEVCPYHQKVSSPSHFVWAQACSRGVTA